MHETPRARLVAYGVAVLATAISLLVRWPLWPVLDNRVRYMTFIPAVVLSAYYGGLWPGLLATFLSAVTGTYFLAEPGPSFAVTSAAEAVGLALFVLAGAQIINCRSERLKFFRPLLVRSLCSRALGHQFSDASFFVLGAQVGFDAGL